MNRLPVEVIQSILMHADIDEDLLQLRLVCRKFAAAVQDTTFALEHIRRRFQLSPVGMERFIKMNEMVHSTGVNDADMHIWEHLQGQLYKFWEQFQDPGQLLFAHKVALFVVASQVGTMYHIRFSVDVILRIVQTVGPEHPVNWENVVTFLTTTDNVSALEQIISNRVSDISNTVIVTAIEQAASLGQTQVLSQLLTCPTSDPEPASLDGALIEAVYASELHCVESILNDPLKRVTRAGRDCALKQSLENMDLDMSVLLVQHGVSLHCLASLFTAESEFVRQLLEQPEVDPSYLNYVLYWRMNNYAVVHMALEWRRTDHLLLFLEFAEKEGDMEPFKIVQDYVDQTRAPAHFREPLLERLGHNQGYTYAIKPTRSKDAAETQESKRQRHAKAFISIKETETPLINPHHPSIVIIRAILLHAEVDWTNRLRLSAHSSQLFLNVDIMFALEHIRRRFRIFEETMKTLSSQITMDERETVYAAHIRTLPTQALLTSAVSRQTVSLAAISDDSLRHLAQTGHAAALDYRVPSIQSFSEALNKAVVQKRLECVNAILNDRLGRVTQQDGYAALCESHLSFYWTMDEFQFLQMITVGIFLEAAQQLKDVEEAAHAQMQNLIKWDQVGGEYSIVNFPFAT
ncbi:hypothetical protein BJ741DRAFT_655575 [Chytriomyces cf. hyalinus JEL632]|nr:hypothetical protein BJ741DRAFT_655575 [Chytriomyces cf. hyalinus JEL632]